MERWYLLSHFEISMIFQDLGNIVFRAVQKRSNCNANNITLSKTQFYKHNQPNKASTFNNFYSILFWFSCTAFFHHVILISSTIFFRVAKVFDSPLSEGYNVRKFEIVFEVFGKFFCQNKYKIIISTEKI